MRPKLTFRGIWMTRVMDMYSFPIEGMVICCSFLDVHLSSPILTRTLIKYIWIEWHLFFKMVKIGEINVIFKSNYHFSSDGKWIKERWETNELATTIVIQILGYWGLHLYCLLVVTLHSSPLTFLIILRWSSFYYQFSGGAHFSINSYVFSANKEA